MSDVFEQQQQQKKPCCCRLSLSCSSSSVHFQNGLASTVEESKKKKKQPQQQEGENKRNGIFNAVGNYPLFFFFCLPALYTYMRITELLCSFFFFWSSRSRLWLFPSLHELFLFSHRMRYLSFDRNNDYRKNLLFCYLLESKLDREFFFFGTDCGASFRIYIRS